jgi:rhomboid family GlyGly-CTERM serine protease
MKRIPILTVTTASLSALLAGASLGGFGVADAAQYDRAALLRGEVWRLVTGHFVHWSFAHLAWDLLAFVILGAVCERRRALFASVILATALIVSIFLFVCCPEVAMYRGLSAIDSALWMWAVFIIGERRVSLALTLLALFFAKLLIESAGASLFVDGITVLPVVHLLGALVGFGGSVAEHKMTAHVALHRDRQRDRVRRRRDESAVVGGVV